MRIGRFLVFALSAAAALSAQAGVPSQSGLSMYIARMVGTALPYSEDTRWESYLTISRIAEVLFHEDRYEADIAQATTETFPGYPLLFLTDNDGDRRADFFAYHEDEGREFTREFGAFFGVGDDPEPRWIVFNNGVIPEALDPDDWVFYWATHQYVDRDGDGRFDLYIGSGMDTDEDGRTGTEDTVWLYDDDQDGLIDRAETNVAGAVREVTPVDGIYHVGDTFARDFDSSLPFFDFPNAMAADISAALKGADR